MKGAENMSTAENKAVCFPNVKDGDTFKVADIEFIKFPNVDGMTPVVTRNILFNSRFGDNNDLRSSEVLKRLKEEYLPKICAAIGEDNVCTFPTDLTTWDGLKPYGVMEDKISIPTMDFYRENVEIFDKYPVKNWWWLATPESAQPHCDPDWILCVSPRGPIYGGLCDDVNGVRPILIFKSSIFGSSNN
jgi:hypothetical protein